MNKDTFRCALGKHEYSEKATKDKHGYTVHMCKHCKLHGCYKWYTNKVYIEYYPNGYPKRVVYSSEGKDIYDLNGRETHYNKRGINIYIKYSNGTEKWLHKGKLVKEKPKNWNPENE